VGIKWSREAVGERRVFAARAVTPAVKDDAERSTRLGCPVAGEWEYDAIQFFDQDVDVLGRCQ
jgi:hypothetical protein